VEEYYCYPPAAFYPHRKSSSSGKACGLRSKTVRNILVLMQVIFSLAEDNDLIPHSPVRNKRKHDVQKHEKPIWTTNQVRLIIETVPLSYRGLFAVAGLTRARLGEILGLQWKQIDLTKKTLRIEQGLWQGQLVPPKTPSSVRTIYFGEALSVVLAEHFREAAHNSSEDFVFSKPDGTPFHPDVLRKDVLYPTLDRLGIPRSSGTSGFHTFRHSVATFVNIETGNLKLAQKLLSHSTIDMTAAVYAHLSAEAEREGALAVERAVYGDLFLKLFPTGNRSSNATVN